MRPAVFSISDIPVGTFGSSRIRLSASSHAKRCIGTEGQTYRESGGILRSEQVPPHSQMKPQHTGYFARESGDVFLPRRFGRGV